MKRELIKGGIRWFLILLVIHLVGMLFYAIILSSSVMQLMAEEEAGKAYSAVLWFGIILNVIVSIAYTKVETTYVDYRKELKESLRAEKGVIDIWKEKHLGEDLIKIGVYLVMQIPLVIFCAVIKYSLTASLFFEDFYVMNVGWYLVTGSPLLGVLLDTVVFGAIFFAARLLFTFLTVRDVKKDMV